ncbi:PAS domain-containing protein [Fuerstiella marisgermanici]|uniref:histidine kinase n=1 Tax=Fuerstiella marisgermanici TaxID=1891926 RepID=A0A1P8WH96_9PLAN|nr:PAS domain-containing protein [Fuerstiella marisgermanici]APZ93456.1 Phytochrome-like protein cph [Fuerstiella marisgermanici]
MVDQMQDFAPLLTVLAKPVLTAAIDAGTFKSVADLVTFFCVTVISLVLIVWATPTAKTRLLRVMAVLYCGSGIFHFLAYWHRHLPVKSSSVIVGSLVAMILILIMALVIYVLKKFSGAEHLAETQKSLNRAKQELSREQYLLSSLVDNLPDCIYFKDADSRFIRCNQRTADIFELATPEDALGKSDHDFYRKEEADEYRADELHIMQTGEPIINKEEYELLPDGQHHWMLSTKLPLRDADGNIIGTFGLSRDITQLKQAEARLTEWRERFELAVKGTNDGLWDWNVQTDEVWYAARFRELLGFEGDDIIAFPNQLKSFIDRLHPEDRVRVMRSFDDHLENRRPHDEEYRLHTVDGHDRWFRGRGQAKWDENGKPVRMAGSIQDVHRRHQEQEELNSLKLQLQQALQGGNVGMWDWDVLTNEVIVSPELMLQIGEDPERPWTSLNDWNIRLHPDDRDAAVQRTQDYIAGRIEEYESSFRLQHANGGYRWILSRGKLFRKDDGQPRRFIGVHVDLTELREAQEALADSEARLTNRSAELERSNRELQQFAYVASHDLQEPLRSVVGFCQLLEREYQDSLDDTGQMYLQMIVDGGKRMQQLISDLLEYSRVGRGNSFESVDLQDTMEQVTALLHSAITESDAKVTFDALPTVQADGAQMVRLFQNLVGNAIKYRGDRSPVVKIWSEESNTEWKLFVSDNGIGIDNEFSDQVFIIFKRLHTREEYPGTGIGLAICRRIVERHRGQIRLLESHSQQVDPDHGCTFEIILPKSHT